MGLIRHIGHICFLSLLLIHDPAVLVTDSDGESKADAEGPRPVVAGDVGKAAGESDGILAASKESAPSGEIGF